MCMYVCEQELMNLSTESGGAKQKTYHLQQPSSSTHLSVTWALTSLLADTCAKWSNKTIHADDEANKS